MRYLMDRLTKNRTKSTKTVKKLRKEAMEFIGERGSSQSSMGVDESREYIRESHKAENGIKGEPK